MKYFKKISALITAFAICSAMSIIPVSAEESADLPDWIPQNFGEAMKFENQYGKTHIEDGLICCVQNQSTGGYYTYETQDADGTLNDLADTVFHETYDCILPQKPDESDEDAYTAYLEQIEEMGLSSYEPYIGRYEYGDMGFQYEVTVYKPTASGTIDLNWVRLRKNEEPYIDKNLTFDISPDGDITETDPYGWIPDSPSECFSTPRLCGNYIVSCDTENFAYGYSTIWEQTGIGKIEEFDRYFVSIIDPFMIDLPWYKVTVYQPVTPGTIQITWNKTQSDDENFLKCTTKTYQIDDDLTIHEIEPVTIMGDVNADGEFSVLDVILFQKWILNAPDVHLDNWKNADFTKDNQLNIFDLLLMKRELIQKNQEQIDYSIAEQMCDIRKNIDQHEEAQAYIAHTFEEFLEIVESAEGEIDENTVPEGLDEAFFEDKAVIVMYTTARSGDTFTLINDIQHQQDKLIISNEVIMPLTPQPDMAYDRNIIVVNQADVQNITSIEFEETIRTYDGFDAEENKAVFNYVRRWIMQNISPINGVM